MCVCLWGVRVLTEGVSCVCVLRVRVHLQLDSQKVPCVRVRVA